MKYRWFIFALSCTCVWPICETAKPMCRPAIRSKDDKNQEALDWHGWDVAEFAGKTATLQIVDAASGGWGHINADHIFQSGEPRTPTDPDFARVMSGDRTSKVPQFTFADTLEEQEAQLKTNPLLLRMLQSRKALAGDPHRPIYHYVNPEGSLNDPNGLCFWQGRQLSSITIDSSYSSQLPDVRSRAPETTPVFLDKNEPLRLRVLVDRSVVEVFVNGRQCVAVRVYPGREDSLGVSLRAQGQDGELKSFDAWQMKGIYD